MENEDDVDLIEPPDISWNKMFTEIEELNDVSQGIKNKILNGWKELAAILGDDWPEYAQEKKHPWIPNWYNKAPWVKAYYGHIGVQLKLLTNKEHIDAIIERLKDSTPISCISAQTEISAAWKIRKSKIDFDFVKPSQRKKSFDIRAIVDRREVGIEISIMRGSQKFAKQYEIFQRIAVCLMGTSIRGTKSAGRILRMLSRPHAEYLISQIKQGQKEVLKENKVVMINEDAFEACLVPKGEEKVLDEWKSTREMTKDNTLTGPDLDSSFGNRLHAKIQRKSKQIAHDMAGVLYLEGIPISFKKDELISMQNFELAEIEEAVYERTNLLFAVLNRFSLGWGPNQRIYGPKIYASKKLRYKLLEDTSLIIPNRFHQFSTLRHKKLINAFLE